ncbi:MAG TPA: AAA family ATPase [Thermoanaerobaculia bacterium]|nr:AAA family ATPase [Thermoanaerobaculia bacterium]
MIYVKRGPAPLDYLRRSHQALHELEAESFPERRLQERTRFRSGLWKLAKRTLLEEFHSKCAYCESPLIESVQADIENWRPKSRYWWLAYDWTNLLIACRACNSAKGDRFPLENEPDRASSRGEEFKEYPLLLNPCWDRPEEHLVFGEDGRVFSDTQCGQVTIDTLMLNRQALVMARRRTVIQALALLDVVKAGQSPKLLFQMIMDDAPYAGAARQALGRELEKFKHKGLSPRWLHQLEAKLLVIAGTSTLLPKDVRSTKSAYEAHEQIVEAFSLPENEGEQVSEHYFAKRRTIERISIKNFKAIRQLDINLAGAPEEMYSWLMLLGENATGKSSVLKALALTLMGEKKRRELGLRPDDVLSHGASEGRIRVWLTGVSKPLELQYRSGDEIFEGETSEKVLLLGYGSTRLLPKAEVTERSSSPRGPIEVGNLFDPTVKLVDAEGWLGSLTEPELFGAAVRVLKELLPLRSKDYLEKKVHPNADGRHQIFVRMFGHEVSLDELSDGYQSVVALAADVLSVLLPVWKDRVESAEGIVLIDKLDAHLHPTWRMRMVQTLRRCFPHVQFVTTSHDPLCLKGLRAGEVVVLRRTRRGSIVAVEDLPSPEGMSVDQLLTSEHFGLGSTVEPEVEKLFRQYYALLARKERSASQEKRLEQLKARLARLNHMGRTRREQLMLEVIDAYLAEDPPSGRQAQEERRLRLLEQLVEKWTGKENRRQV